MEVTIDWRWTTTLDDPCWLWDKALYAYFVDERLIYIGKAEASTVRQRLLARDKAKLRQEVYAEIGGNLRRTKVLVGRPKGSSALRATKMVLRDLEGLFIRELKPKRNETVPVNVRRPGIRVRCTGAWPFEQSVFHNV